MFLLKIIKLYLGATFGATSTKKELFFNIISSFINWIKNHKDKNITYTNDELQKYSEKKRAIYKWYTGTNEFIKKVDNIN